MDDIFHPPLLLYMEIIIYICYYCRHHFDAFIFFGISICFCLKRLDHLFVGIFINWHFNRLHYPVQLYLFCFFIAYFIGNIKERVPFHILYYVHLISDRRDQFQSRIKEGILSDTNSFCRHYPHQRNFIAL